MHLFASTVSDWQRAATDLARAEAGRRRLESEQAAGLAVMQQHLKDWGMAVPADYAALEAALNDLMARVDQAEAAERDMASAGDRERALERQEEELEAERRAVFARFGSDEQDQAGLDERLARLDEWRETRDTVRALDRRERELREALSQAPERLRQAEAGEQAALEAAVHEADEQAELLEQRLQEVSAIRQQLRSAGKDQALEKAMADEALAHNALAEQYQQAMLAEAGQFLLDDVEAAYQSEHEPAVLADARQLFQRFTHHAFDVALDDEQGLMARDLTLGGRRRLSELSSGTRMQLLLSVRLAWTRQLERQYEALPLFLDEALTTSDESRFREVAESLSALAEEEGRQIFYLSARQQERVFWEQLAGLKPHHVDLADVRFGPAAPSAADYALPPMEALPEPGNEAPEQWAAKVGIPAINVRQSPGSIPLFHLLRDDLALLYQLMQRYRVRTLGQLEVPAAIGCGGAGHSRTVTGASNWPVVVSRPMSGSALACMGGASRWTGPRWRPRSAVSDTFMDRVCEQADALNGDGEALIEALANKAVSGFRNDKREELAEFLQAEGYISQEAPLDAEARLQRAVWSSARDADEDDTRQLFAWLEAGLQDDQPSK
jgi:DNA repair protein SbcC/Rad50